MNSRYTFIVLFFSILWSCGPEKTIDTRDASAQIAGDAKDLDFSSAMSEEQFNRNYLLNIQWSKPPQAGARKDNRFMLRVTDLEGNPIELKFLDFRLYMKIHGHGGLDKNRSIIREDLESFICSNFFFTMSGPWELKLLILIGKEKYAFDFPVDVDDES